MHGWRHVEKENQKGIEWSCGYGWRKWMQGWKNMEGGERRVRRKSHV